MGPEKVKRIDRRTAVLRSVERNGGRTGWSDLHGDGHSFSTVFACIHAGELSMVDGSRYRYELTDAGRAALA